jgi:hypothetical protein
MPPLGNGSSRSGTDCQGWHTPLQQASGSNMAQRSRFNAAQQLQQLREQRLQRLNTVVASSKHDYRDGKGRQAGHASCTRAALACSRTETAIARVTDGNCARHALLRGFSAGVPPARRQHAPDRVHHRGVQIRWILAHIGVHTRAPQKAGRPFHRDQMKHSVRVSAGVVRMKC